MTFHVFNDLLDTHFKTFGSYSEHLTDTNKWRSRIELRAYFPEPML
jgi:hypothetical protein